MFLDDERDPVDGDWIIVRSYEAAIEEVSKRGLPLYISFDHDLGANAAGEPLRTGYDFAKWLGEFILDNRPDMTGFTWYVHSQNPVGAKNINEYLAGLVRSLA